MRAALFGMSSRGGLCFFSSIENRFNPTILYFDSSTGPKVYRCYNRVHATMSSHSSSDSHSHSHSNPHSHSKSHSHHSSGSGGGTHHQHSQHASDHHHASSHSSEHHHNNNSSSLHHESASNEPKEKPEKKLSGHKVHEVSFLLSLAGEEVQCEGKLIFCWQHMVTHQRSADAAEFALETLGKVAEGL
jgi:hypothetical protein